MKMLSGITAVCGAVLLGVCMVGQAQGSGIDAAISNLAVACKYENKDDKALPFAGYPPLTNYYPADVAWQMTIGFDRAFCWKVYFIDVFKATIKSNPALFQCAARHPAMVSNPAFLVVLQLADRDQFLDLARDAVTNEAMDEPYRFQILETMASSRRIKHVLGYAITNENGYADEVVASILKAAAASNAYMSLYLARTLTGGAMVKGADVAAGISIYKAHLAATTGFLSRTQLYRQLLSIGACSNEYIHDMKTYVEGTGTDNTRMRTYVYRYADYLDSAGVAFDRTFVDSLRTQLVLRIQYEEWEPHVVTNADGSIQVNTNRPPPPLEIPGID